MSIKEVALASLSLASLSLASLLALLCIALYILRAYLTRNDDDRIKFLIQNKFSQFGDGSLTWDQGAVSNISVRNVRVTPREISATITYDHNGKPKTLNKTYTTAKPCLTSSCIAY